MATIVIKDLIESADLDRQAMLSITGGARSSKNRPITGLSRARAESSSLIQRPTLYVPRHSGGDKTN